MSLAVLDVRQEVLGGQRQSLGGRCESALTVPRMPLKHHTSAMWSEGVPSQVAIHHSSTQSVRSCVV